MTTIFTATRLTTKLLISKYGVEDSEFHISDGTGRVVKSTIIVDMLLVAWVSTRAAAKSVFPERGPIDS